MIVVRIWGGLGNQMFQYAMGYAVACGKQRELLLDTSFFTKEHNERQTKRELDLFALPIETKDIANPTKDVSFLLPLLQKPSVNFIIRKVLPICFRIGKFVYVKEDKLQYLPKVVSIKSDNIYYDGYWHSEKYFKKYREELLRQFTFSNDKIEEEYGTLCGGNLATETIAIHIRRGDYISQNNPNARGVDYYRKAIEVIKKKVSNARICFFSDDLKWVQDNFGDVENSILSNRKGLLNDIEEFQLMAKCRHQVISNSSYSWWAAWLNTNPNKVVIVPAVWKNKKDMMLDDWIKI